MKTLTNLAVGGRGRVEKIDGTDAISVRLMEMGITPGVEMELIGTAPLGDPLEFQIRGYRLSLRRNEADRVAIKPA